MLQTKSRGNMVELKPKERDEKRMSRGNMVELKHELALRYNYTVTGSRGNVVELTQTNGYNILRWAIGRWVTG
jgi:hypothetical protein